MKASCGFNSSEICDCDGLHCTKRPSFKALIPTSENVKRSNPKDACGTGKVPFSTVPAVVVAEIGLAMLEGARKYRRHNYRAIGVRASVYYDAALRHLTAWWEGEDTDPDSGLSHITKALSTLTVLRDAMLNEKMRDDRPPAMRDQKWLRELNERASAIVAKYPNDLPPYTNKPEDPP